MEITGGLIQINDLVKHFFPDDRSVALDLFELVGHVDKKLR